MTALNEKNLSGQPGMEISENEGGEMEINLVELFLRLLEKWKIIAASALAGLLVFAIVTACFIAPTYTATAKLYVVNATNAIVNLSDFQLSNYLASDYMEVFANHEVHDLVKERLGLTYSYKKLDEMLTVTNPASTRLLYIKVDAPTAEEAEKMANTYAEVAIEVIPTKMDANAPKSFEEAQLPKSPSSPNLLKNMILGFLAGAVISCAAIAILFVMDDRIRTKEDIEKHLGLPTLGLMPLGQQTAEGKAKKAKKAGRKGNKRV